MLEKGKGTCKISKFNNARNQSTCCWYASVIISSISLIVFPIAYLIYTFTLPTYHPRAYVLDSVLIQSPNFSILNIQHFEFYFFYYLNLCVFKFVIHALSLSFLTLNRIVRVQISVGSLVFSLISIHEFKSLSCFSYFTDIICKHFIFSLPRQMI